MKNRTTSLVVLAACAFACAGACSVNETPPPPHGAYDGGAGAALPCVPNLDGKIDANELQAVTGVTATYLVSPPGKDRGVDLAGAPNAQGQLEWNMGTDFADDLVAKIAAQPLDKQWYAPSFAGLKDAFVTPIDAGDTTEGVYTEDDHAFYLHGVASTKPDAPEGKTLLVYTSPIELYRFPIVPGAAWQSVGEVKDGTFRGLPYAGRDTYDVKVDGSGVLVLPDLTITQAMRVRTNVTVSPAAGQVTTQRQVSFMFECLGEVARVTSKPNEPQENFTTAAEVRRLGLAP